MGCRRGAGSDPSRCRAAAAELAQAVVAPAGDGAGAGRGAGVAAADGEVGDGVDGPATRSSLAAPALGPSAPWSWLPQQVRRPVASRAQAWAWPAPTASRLWAQPERVATDVAEVQRAGGAR